MIICNKKQGDSQRGEEGRFEIIVRMVVACSTSFWNQYDKEHVRKFASLGSFL